MKYLDVNAIVNFGLALGRLAGETVDEKEFRKWVDEVAGAINRKEVELSQDTSKRGCLVTISTSCRSSGDNGLGENIVLFRKAPDNSQSSPERGSLTFDWALGSLRCPEGNDPIPDWGSCCYDMGACKICITWTCSIFEYEVYPLI